MTAKAVIAIYFRHISNIRMNRCTMSICNGRVTSGNASFLIGLTVWTEHNVTGRTSRIASAILLHLHSVFTRRNHVAWGKLKYGSEGHFEEYRVITTEVKKLTGFFFVLPTSLNFYVFHFMRKLVIMSLPIKRN